jgi:hypothetical protein
MLCIPGEAPLFSAGHPLASSWQCLTGRRDRRTIALDISELVLTPIILILIEAAVFHSRLLHIPQFLQYDIAHGVLPPLTTQQ